MTADSMTRKLGIGGHQMMVTVVYTSMIMAIVVNGRKYEQVIPVDFGIAVGSTRALELKKLGSSGSNDGDGGSRIASSSKTYSSSSSVQLQSSRNKRSDVANEAENNIDEIPLLYNYNILVGHLHHLGN